MIRRNFKIFTVIFFVTFVVGCAGDNKWSCPLPESGKSCSTITKSDSDNFTQSLSEKDQKKYDKTNKDILSNTVVGIKIDDLKPVRTKEVIGKILITPYIDKTGNLNSGKYIYTIDEKPEWKIN